MRGRGGGLNSLMMSKVIGDIPTYSCINAFITQSSMYLSGIKSRGIYFMNGGIRMSQQPCYDQGLQNIKQEREDSPVGKPVAYISSMGGMARQSCIRH